MDKAMQRLSVIQNQFANQGPDAGGVRLLANPCSAGDSAAYARQAPGLDDVVVVSSLRTATCKARRGGLASTPPDDMLATLFKSTFAKTGVDPKDVGDVVIGSVLGPSSQRANECRIAMFLAGMPETVPVHTVNRQCSSGLQAIASVAASIKAGYYTIGLAGGVETMSSNPMKWEGGVNPAIEMSKQAQSCMLPMGITSENVAAKFGLSRTEQDAFAASSHNKAAAAAKAGKFKDEIVPVHTKVTDPKTKETRPIVVDADDGIRAGTTVDSLARLKPAFKASGSTTAGNSSQVSDGAAVTLLMTRREAQRRGLPVLGVFRSFAAVGVDPAIMGVGPAVAIPEAVRRAGLTLDDIDVYEINEAFASQALYCVRELGIDPGKVNPNGGAIALGHALGCTGSRMTATLLHEMKRRGRGARFGIVSMCIGSGMGAAAVYEVGDQADGTAHTSTLTPQGFLSKDAV
eukprot:jgi/Ulvmu1/10139/UM006_0093.1